MPGLIRDVLFLVADQWRGDTLGILGTPGVRTPNLDALAERSVLFTNHWCQSSPCGPARATLLTGTETPTHGQWTNSDPADHGLETLPSACRNAGLAPLLIGYTDTPTGPGPGSGRDYLYDPGFDLVRPFFWQRGFPAYRRTLLERGYGSLSDETMGIYPVDGEPTEAGLAPSRVAAADSDVAWLTDAAVDVIRQRPEPLLLHLNWLRPHPPLVPPAPYHRIVHPDEVLPPRHKLPFEARLALHPLFDLTARNRSMGEYLQRRVRIESVDEQDERRIRAAYYGLCAEVDHHIGRLLAELRATGRDRSTLVVFLSDHGDALGDQWLYGRRGPFDGHFRVPCLIHDPRPEADGSRGATVDAFTANIDVMPTILDAIGRPAPASAEGVSLLPFMHGAAAPRAWRTEVRLRMDWTDQIPRSRRAEVGRNERLRFAAVRTARHRFVQVDGFEPMLFDLREDPNEVANRINDPTCRAIACHLESMLIA